jgi:Rrf2 family cysteine metabolism transcriptional repressor
VKLSTRARYALRMMLDLARYAGEGTVVPLAAVASRTNLSRGYLEQLAMGLRRARLLRGVPGRKGGYRLARPASTIKVGDVIEASIGPVCIVDCVDDPSICAKAGQCECRIFYSLINERILTEARSHTLEDLLDQTWLMDHGGTAAGPGSSVEVCTGGRQATPGTPKSS